ncbi:hypothetical protein BDV97DRAFT_223712 [Delphinella strobiligena]|nr:hypothetical protein BDV97DRAFT_223712 [Delphinella strobiligena]
MTKAMSLTLFELLMVIISIVNAQGLQMPTCLSNCMTPFSANHEPDLCTAPWINSITTCIDSACSTTSSSSSPTTYLAVGVLANISLTFVPKVQYDCEQSDIPGSGDKPASPALLVTEGHCVESPYKFLSFLPTYIDDAAMLDCQLQLFTESGCGGEVTNLTLSDVNSGKCSFESGKSVRLACGSHTDVATDRAAEGQSDNAAAHAYLDWLCNVNSTTTATASPSDTATRSSLSATTGMANSTLPSCGNVNTTCANTPVNSTTTGSMSATPTLHAIFETGLSRAERMVGRQETARLALVVAIFARNLLL